MGVEYDGLVLHIISERVEPGEHARVPLPRWEPSVWCRRSDALQRLALCFEIGLGVVVRRVEADVSEPAADDGDVDARRDEMDGGRMTEAVRGHMLRPECRRRFSRCLHVGGELEPHARCTERLAIP